MLLATVSGRAVRMEKEMEMPRKTRNVLKMGPWSSPPKEPCRVRITDATVEAGGKSARIVLEHIAEPYLYRTHELVYGELRPQGPLTDLLRAAGCDVSVGAEIDLDTMIVGKVIALRFEPGTDRIKAFEPIEETNDGHAGGTAGAADNHGKQADADLATGR